MPKKIKIAINARFLNKPFTGIGNYSFNLICELSKIAGDEAELLLISEADLMNPYHAKLAKFKNIKFITVFENRVLYKLNKGLAKSHWECNQFAKRAEKLHADLIFTPYPTLLKRKKIPLIVTVHDAIPWLDREYSSASWLGKIYNQRALKLLKKADLILTVSDTSKAEIIMAAPFLESKIEVVHNGVSDLFLKKVSNPEANVILKKYSIPENCNYLFYYGGFDKRKNTSRLIRIFNNFLAKKLHLKLVLGGGRVLNNNLFEDFSKLKNENIIQTGFIDEEDLPVLIQKSLAMINISRLEGFNLPLAEAMAAQSLCFVGDIAVNREIGGECPVFLNLDKNDESIAKKILEILENEEKISEKKMKCSVYKNKYSWKLSAKKTWSLFQKVLY